MNDHENPADPEHDESPREQSPTPSSDAPPDAGTGSGSSADAAHVDDDAADGGAAHAGDAHAAADADAPSAADPAPASEESEFTSLYVRRGRTPTLGFWVALAIVLPALAALLSAPLFDFADISGVLNFMLVAAVFVGLPLAAIAALVDAIRHRGEGRRTR